MQKIKIGIPVKYDGTSHDIGSTISVGDKYAKALVDAGKAGYVQQEDNDVLSNNTVKQLKDMAKDEGMKGYSTLSKSELVKELKEHRQTKELKEEYQTK